MAASVELVRTSVAKIAGLAVLLGVCLQKTAMHLENLRLTHFKNHEDAHFEFSKQVNCVVGENGSGKTNLLDAVYFLALSKSAFHNQDALSIAHDADFFIVDGTFEKDGKHIQITCSLQRGQRKVLMSDKKAYERVSDHIGRFPVVLVAPNDTDLVRDGSEERRRFFDGVLAQLDQHYLQDLLLYNRVIAQRNGVLKLFNERQYIDKVLLDTYDQPLLECGKRIYERRAEFMKQFLPLFREHYAFLSDSREQVEIIYESEVGDARFEQEFLFAVHRDLAAQRTTRGIHKDDFIFEIDRQPLRKFGSQGQQKSFVVALKLAQFALLEIEKEVKPILLLDDIFDKLDDRRIGKLIALMENGTFSQVFLTDARPERTQQLLSALKSEVKYFRIERNL
jgi:DNA replication and repair protein RecF